MTERQPPCVLYMEDDEATARLVMRVLESAGLAVQWVPDGAEGLDRCLRETFDAILVDQNLPGREGLEVVRELAAANQLPPAIMLTAAAGEKAVAEAMKLGASDYFVKDAHGKYLVALPAAIRSAVESRGRRLGPDGKRLEEQVRLNEHRIGSLLRLGRMAGASVREIMDVALEEAVQMTESAMGYLALVNEDETVLTMQAWSRAAMAACRTAQQPIVYPVERTGLWGEAVRQRKPVITNDYDAPNPLKKGCPQGHVPIRRHMNVPVFDGDRIVAVIGVANKQAVYDDADVRHLVLLMEGMWKHIQLRRSDEELARYRDQLERLVGERTSQLADANRELEQSNQQLAIRARHVDCLHAISRLLESTDLSLPRILQEAAELIPPACRHNDSACARIVLDGQVFETQRYCESMWKQAAPIVVEGRLAGALEVDYLGPAPTLDECPFLQEERELVLDVGQRLGRVIERCRAQAKVKALQEQIEYVLGATKTNLCIVDTDFRIEFVDPAAQRTWGDPAGRPCHDYLYGRGAPCDDCGTIKAARTTAAVVTEQTLPRDGNRPVRVTSIPFQNEQGEWRVAKVFVDLTHQKRLERELAHAQKLEAIGQLAAGIAHEINTPTQYVGDNVRFLQEAFGSVDGVLRGLSQLLDAAKDGRVSEELLLEIESLRREADVEFLSAEVPRALEEAREGVDRVAAIVRAMKEFSHPGGEQQQAVDLNRALHSTLTVSRNEWKYAADLVTDFEPDMPPVLCFAGDLNQAVLNVLVNAGQAMAGAARADARGKGTLTVRTRRDGDWAEICIRDTGPGIPEDIRSRIFEPFFTTKEVGKGTGQGLAIAYNTIVKKHQGTIRFETHAGAGTTFVIRLPIQGVSREPAAVS